MLTTTYTFLSLSIERDKAISLISALQACFQGSAVNLQRLAPESLVPILNQLVQFNDFCRRRKINVYVIPALRSATKDADSLLAELESISSMGASILIAVRDRLQEALAEGFAQITDLFCSMDLWCRSLLQRLAKEDAELLPLAKRVLSSEQWFALGAKFLSIDAAEYAVPARCSAPSRHSLPAFRSVSTRSVVNFQH